jgi:5-deoxy-glucuronate isomerase
MPKLLVRRRTDGGSIHAITPQSAGWHYVGFEVVDMRAGDMVERHTGDREYCLVLARGRAAISAAGVPTSLPARLIDPATMSQEVRGSGTNTRHVRNILPENEPAESLLVVEVITPGGNWSSYPPHKHDSDRLPEESNLEETYYHRLSSPGGFAFQRVYTDDRSIDETMAVGDRDVVLVPRGYHPVGAPHGYDLYYLNVMAGPRRIWKFFNDPAHAWMLKK